MRGIQVAVSLCVVISAPATGASLHFVHLSSKIVNVSCFSVQQLTKNPQTTHVENKQLFTAIADVFHHHAMASSLFGYLDKLPTSVDRSRCGHFDERVHSLAHCLDCHTHVVFPGSTN